ncbi:hypothetical protein H4R26_002142 [Coemansia thaxteri]|uniref:Major facilitator superfamily (MFS) profile domain-containing protein n=1 Tax=Coemansia thaxteri TaxID=2663907 RepID=A0A9W8BFG3_9FUNG|nr:hypothetical protein H4R26_002142 [Coemansia thaxteri]
MRQAAQDSMLFSRISLQGAAANGRGLKDILLEYYSHTEYRPSHAQIEKDRYVFFGLLPCRQWMAIPAGILIQFCYGSVYAWSIFNAPINTAMSDNPDTGGAEITFYIALGVLGFTGAIFGPWIESSHPQKSGIIGLVVFYSGHLTSALALQVRMMSLLYFGYGFVAGVGLGIGYVSTIDAVSKWWPKARGTAAGCAVMGFGGGSLAFSAINKWLLDHTSLPLTFLILGTINVVVMFICIQFICPPPPGHNLDGIPMIDEAELTLPQPQFQRQCQRLGEVGSAAKHGAHPANVESEKQARFLAILGSERPVLHISLAEALRSRDFWLLYVSFLANIVFCLVILSNLPKIINRLFGQGSKVPKDPPLPAYLAVSIEGGFNMAGRVLVGLISDMAGRKTTFLIILLMQIVVLASLPFAIQAESFWGFLTLVWVATTCYGGGFGMIPAFIADMFGINNTSSCHGVILTAWSLASICGGLAFTGVVNRFIDHGSMPYETRIYTVNFLWMLGVVIVGFACCLFIRSSIRDRLFPALPGQILRMRVFGRVLRLIYSDWHSDGRQPASSATDCGSTSQTENSNSCLRYRRCKGQLRCELLTKHQEQQEWEEFLVLRAVQHRLMKEPDV